MEYFDDRLGTFEYEARLEAKRARQQRSKEYSVRTTNLWAGLGVFGAIVIALFLFAYLTLFRDRPKLLGSMVIAVLVVLALTGWKLVADRNNGAGFIGRLFGT
jgi:hypothetical protein